MPGLNQTGPTGQGSMTGRKMGRCSNFGSTSANNTEGRDRTGNHPWKFQGRCFGSGRHKGERGGRRFGAGERNRLRGDF